MKHIERRDGKVVGVYENPQYHRDGTLRTEPVADDAVGVLEFYAEVEKRSIAMRRTVAVKLQEVQ